MNDQCSFVRANCPEEEGLFSYLQFYYCALANSKPVAFIILIIWLSLLFSTIGIAASDFLCINLSTLASILGLSESLTGVTFLAFGNGSPDVFSTFAAMKSNSGSLAIGELLGAAGFITSVVAGSMAIVRPFRVARRSFIRDVGYFVVAVGFSMFFVADGRLYAWESATMVGLYIFYVVLVVTWHWYLKRQRRVYDRNVAARSHFHIPNNQELEIEEAPENDDPGVSVEPESLPGASAEDFDILERSGMPAWKEGNEDDETRNRYLAEIRENMHVYRPTSARRRNTLNPIRPSLVGALEFQTVLSSLQRSRATPQDSSINLDRYFDNPDEQPQYQSDNPSVISDQSPMSVRPNDVASPGIHAESTNDPAASGEGRDVSEDDRGVSRLVSVTVSGPSGEQGSQSDAMPLQAPSPGQPARDLSPSGPGATQSPGLLAPPDTFRSPNYQAGAGLSRSRSQLQVSPRGTPLDHRTPRSPRESPPSPFPAFQDSASSRASSISLPDAPTPSESLLTHVNPFSRWDRRPKTIRWWPYRFLPPPQSLKSNLFPTLSGWKAKSIWGRFLDIVAAPSVLLLTITVPVVEPEAATDPAPVVVAPADGREGPAPPVRLPEESPPVQALDRQLAAGQGATASNGDSQHNSTTGRPRLDSELPASRPPGLPSTPKEWSRWLVSLQLFAGPFFIALVGWTATDPHMHARNLLLPSLISLLFSLLCLTCLIVSTRHNHPSQPPGLWRPFLSLLGFVVAISWIACIATEVVSLLKTLGVILNISDSLLGLTIFAVGNSLGDLVADITVARLGYPVMALSACFGGPMLNILLGIGLGGLYMTLTPRSELSSAAATVRPEGSPYEITISRVLAISSASLLITLVGLLIVIPLNNWRMDRKVGCGLVVLWTVSTVTNIIVEVAA